MSAIANKPSQYSLFGSLLPSPYLSTERVVISGNDQGMLQVSVQFSLDSNSGQGATGPAMAEVANYSSWKDTPSKNNIFSINFRKFLKIHVIQLYGNYAGQHTGQYLNFLNTQDIRGFYEKFKNDIANTNYADVHPRDVPAQSPQIKEYVIPFAEALAGNDRGFQDIFFQKSFNISHTPGANVLNLSYFFIPYIDLNDLKNDFPDMDLQILAGDYDGDIRAITAGIPVYQSVLLNGETKSSAKAYQTPEGTYWTGATKTTPNGEVLSMPNERALTVIKVPNSIVQDLRPRKHAKPNLLEFKKLLTIPSSNYSNRNTASEGVKISPKKSYFSELYLSTDINGSARGLFMFSLEKFLRSEAVFSALMTSKVNDISYNRKIISMSSIKTIKIFRKQVEKTLSSTMEEKWAPEKMKDGSVQLMAFGSFNETGALEVEYPTGGNFTLRQEDVDFDNTTYNMPNGTRGGIRKFAFYDEELREHPTAVFQYEVELEIEDGSVSYIKDIYSNLETSIHDVETIFNDAIQPGIPGATPHYDHKRDKFTSSWRNGTGARNDLLLQAVRSYSEGYGILLAPTLNSSSGIGSSLKSTLTELRQKIISFLDYNYATLSTYNAFMRMQKELLAVLEDMVRMKGAPKMLAGADSSGARASTGATPRISKLKHTFKNIFDTRMNVEGMALGYDILLNANSDVSKMIMQRSGMAYQKGLLALGEEQFRSRAVQETLKYFKKSAGPLVIPGEKVDLNDTASDQQFSTGLGLSPGTELFTKQIEGGDINDNALTYLTPASIMLHGKIVDLATINSAADTKSSLPLGKRKYPRAVSDVLLKKYGIDTSFVKDRNPAHDFAGAFGNATQVAPLSAAGVIGTTPPPYVSPMMPPLSSIETAAPKKDNGSRQLRTDLHMILEAAGASVYPDISHMPETKRQAEVLVEEKGMGGIGPGKGMGFAPFDPKEMGELRWGSPEIEGPENGDGDLKPPPLSFSMAMLSNVLFNKSAAKRSINDFAEPPVDEEDLNVLPGLPNQLKSLYAGMHENNLVKTKILSKDKDIINDYSNVGLYYFNYQLIYKIEVLRGFEADGITGAVYEPLSDKTIEKHRGKTLLCKASLYSNSKIIDPGVHSKMHLPLLNEFFLLEVAGVKPEDLVAETDDFDFSGDFLFIPPIALQEDYEPEISGVESIIIPGLFIPTTGGGYRT